MEFFRILHSSAGRMACQLSSQTGLPAVLRPQQQCARPTGIRTHRRAPRCTVLTQVQSGSAQADLGAAPQFDTPPQQPVSVPKPAMIRLCGMEFNFHTARNFVATRMHQYAPGSRVQPGDHQMLLELIEFHPAKQEKTGPGIRSFVVQHSEHGTLCFWVERTDGTLSDFSYIKCLQSMDHMYRHGLVDDDGHPIGPVVDLRHLSVLPSRPMQQQRRQPQQRQRQQRPSRQPPPPITDYNAMGAYTGSVGPRQQLQAPVLSADEDDWFAAIAGTELPSAQQSWPPAAAHSQPALPVSQSPRPDATVHPAPPQSHPQGPPGRVTHYQQQLQNSTHREVQPAPDCTWQECLQALRSAILAQLKQYKQSVLSSEAGRAGSLVCAVTGQVLRDNNSMVRYNPPHTLKDVAVAWMKGEGLQGRHELKVGYVEGVQGPVMMDPGLMASWQKYHALHAQVQLVHKDVNARKQRE